MMTDLPESIEDGVATLTLNRPDRLNALSEDMLAKLCEALPRLGNDPAVGAIILTGAGGGFCAGDDVKRMAAADQTFEQRQEGLRWRHQAIVMLRTMPKVVIGAINGPVAGAGLGIALACDMRLAARTARFRTAFADVGFSGDFGGSWSLTRLVGTAKAREMYFLNPLIDADEALRLGLVTAVVDDAALPAEAMALARRIAGGPRVAYAYMKRNLHAAETEPLQAVLDMEAIGQARTGLTEDHREAAAAFTEKRKPVFRGR